MTAASISETTRKSITDLEQECCLHMFKNGFKDVPLPLDTSGTLVRFDSRQEDPEATEWYNAYLKKDGTLLVIYNSNHNSFPVEDRVFCSLFIYGEDRVFCAKSNKPLSDRQQRNIIKKVKKMQNEKVKDQKPLPPPNTKEDFEKLTAKVKPEAARQNKKEEVEVPSLSMEKNYEDHGEYFVNSTGVYFKEENKEEKHKFISSPIWAIAHLRSFEGSDHTLLIKVHDGEVYHEFLLPRNRIQKTTDLIEQLTSLGQYVSPKPANQKHLQEYLLKLNPKKKIRGVKFAGWHEDVYVFPNGETIGEVDGKEEIRLMSEFNIKGVGSKGTPLEWQKNVLPKCKGNSLLIFGIGVGLSALITSKVDGEGGVFHLKGLSSRGKTIILKASTGTIGFPDEQKGYIKSWNSTANAIEGVCETYNDSLLPMDELGRSEGADAGKTAYSITSGSGKGRMKQTTELRDEKSWCCTVLSTGELGLEAHMSDGGKKIKAGQAVRFTDIPAVISDKYGCFENIHNYANSKEFVDSLQEACKEYYGTASREFLKQFISNGTSESAKSIRDCREAFIKGHAIDKDGQIIRIASRFGLVEGALLFAKKHGVLGEVLSDDEISEAVGKVFKCAIEERGTNTDHESFKVISQVEEMLREHMDSRFKPFKDISQKGEEGIRLQKNWGFHDKLPDKDVFYVLGAGYKEITAGFERRAAGKALVDANILKPRNDKGKEFTGTSETIPSLRKKGRYRVITLLSEEANE